MDSKMIKLGAVLLVVLTSLLIIIQLSVLFRHSGRTYLQNKAEKNSWVSVAEPIHALQAANRTAIYITASALKRGGVEGIVPRPVLSEREHEEERPTWKKKTFCYDYLVNTFHDALPMCGKEVTKMDQVKCSGTVYTNHMAQCSFENLALNPQNMIDVIPSDTSWKKPAERTINLLESLDASCQSPSVNQLSKKTDFDDIQIRLARHLLESEKLAPSVCDVWINKTTIFHVSNALHIYFRFNDLYSVHKTLFDLNLADSLVLRVGSMSSNYRFPEFDKALFPGALTLKDLPQNSTICFKKVFLSPRSYQSVPFRSKMESTLRSRCFECSGKDLTGSPLYTFRTRVLKACNITDQCSNTSRIVVVSRKFYKRWTSDEPKNFQRILSNECEMVLKIQQAFPKVTVDIIHMEDLNICEQVRYAVEADVMLGVHGAGLIHFWWLRDKALGLELEPSFEAGNPSFKMLTKISGRNYMSERILGTSKMLLSKLMRC